MKRTSTFLLVLGSLLVTLAAAPASAQDSPPNIVIIWGDDIGQSNISAYTMGVMGFKTPNIDRVANEGMIFTDYYAEQSCTAGRSAFITGQSVFRTGLSKVGMPGADLGMRKEDPTIAELLKPHGLRHRPVRQEPPGRPGRHAAHEPRFRRVLRQPLPPERRGGTGASRLLSRDPEFRQEIRAAGRDPQLCRRPGRGHRPADQEAHGDHRRRRRRPGGSVHRRSSTRPANPSSSGSTSPTCTSAPMPSPRASARPGAGRASTTTS